MVCNVMLRTGVQKTFNCNKMRYDMCQEIYIVNAKLDESQIQAQNTDRIKNTPEMH